MTTKYDREHPRYLAKDIVRDHEFRSYVDRGSTIVTGGYSTPSDLAQAMVDAYFQDREPGAQHKTVAVAAIHAASLVFNCQEYQVDLAEEYDMGAQTIGRHYEHMLVRVMPPLNDEYDVH